jgi:hypothetical protein
VPNGATRAYALSAGLQTSNSNRPGDLIRTAGPEIKVNLLDRTEGVNDNVIDHTILYQYRLLISPADIVLPIQRDMGYGRDKRSRRMKGMGCLIWISKFLKRLRPNQGRKPGRLLLDSVLSEVSSTRRSMAL